MLAPVATANPALWREPSKKGEGGDATSRINRAPAHPATEQPIAGLRAVLNDPAHYALYDFGYRQVLVNGGFLRTSSVSRQVLRPLSDRTG